MPVPPAANQDGIPTLGSDPQHVPLMNERRGRGVKVVEVENSLKPIEMHCIPCCFQWVVEVWIQASQIH